MFNRIAIPCVIALALSAPAAWAHHSYAMFDRGKTVTLDGTVKQYQWTNPHSWIQVEVPHDGGGTDEWSVEMGSPFELLRVGWKPTTVKAGDKVTIQIHPTKDGSKGGGFVGGTDANGHELGGGK
jgi:heme/copper-type cytochrome/quinol oxidase subunit 2